MGKRYHIDKLKSKVEEELMQQEELPVDWVTDLPFSEDDGINEIDENLLPQKSSDERDKKLALEAEELGFSPKDTWSLKTTMMELLYERLNSYLEKASPVINLEHHKFYFRGTHFNQKEMIVRMVSLAEECLLEEYGLEEITEEEAHIKSVEFWEIWALVHPWMWW